MYGNSHENEKNNKRRNKIIKRNITSVYLNIPTYYTKQAIITFIFKKTNIGLEKL